MWILEMVINFFLPASCVLCKRGSSSLCQSCCQDLKKNITTLPKDTHAFFSYQDKSVRFLLRAGKYKHKKGIIRTLANALFNSEKHIFAIHSPTQTLIIPVPMPFMRQLVRGYNHTEVFACELSSLTEIPFSFKVLRRHNTVSQVLQKSKRARLINPRGSFFLAKNAHETLSGRHILLVDDIITTGATAGEARKMLEKANPASITIVCLAH